MTTPLRSPSLRRRTTAASAALLVGLALTACGGGDDEASDDTSPRASDTGSATTATAPSEPISSITEDAPADLPSEDELQAALLTTDDVPEGFTVSPDDGDDSGSSFTGTCLADVGKFSDAFGSEPDEEAKVEYALESATTQASVSSQVQAYADTTALASTFTTFTDQLQSCTSVQATEDGVDYALEIAYDDTVDLTGADDQLAFDITGTIGSGEQTYPVAFRFVVALSGSLISLVGAYTIGDDTSGVVDTTHDLAELQAGRVADLG